MNESEVIDAAVEQLNKLTGQADPECDHQLADDILLSLVPEEVKNAYQRLIKRSRWWA